MHETDQPAVFCLSVTGLLRIVMHRRPNGRLTHLFGRPNGRLTYLFGRPFGRRTYQFDRKAR
jgi:hypothetical protein